MKKQVPQEILDCCQDRGELPEFFDIEIGKDFRLETKPDYHAEIREPRKVKIVVSTFRGVSAGAIHYYATIEADGIRIYYLENNRYGKVGRVYCGGYLGEEYKKLPREKQAVGPQYMRLKLVAFSLSKRLMQTLCDGKATMTGGSPMLSQQSKKQ